MCCITRVRLGDRINTSLHHLLQRPRHAHAALRIHRLRHQTCDDRVPACREADAGQCRIIVNALRREIDRLIRQGYGECGIVNSLRVEAASHTDIDTETFGLSVPPRHRKVYAMPTAATSDCHRQSPPPQSRFVNAHLQVTNLGTLLDVLG